MTEGQQAQLFTGGPVVIFGLTGLAIAGLIGAVIGLACAAPWLFLVLYRNHWVFKARMAVLDQGLDEYHKLEPYDTMLMRWWCWNIEEFKT